MLLMKVLINRAIVLSHRRSKELPFNNFHIGQWHHNMSLAYNKSAPTGYHHYFNEIVQSTATLALTL